MDTARLLLMTGAAGRYVGERRKAIVNPLKVLLATDGSDQSAVACRFLQQLAFPPGSAIRVVSVVTQPPAPGLGVSWTTVGEMIRSERAGAEEANREAEALLPGEDVPVTTRIHGGDPVTEILEAAQEFDADLVVVGSKGLTGLRGFLLGSVARAVAERCERPVLVARAPRNGLQDVIVATDASVHAAHAVQFAARLPLPDVAWSTVIHVVRPCRTAPEYLYLDQEEHRRAAAELRRKQVETGRSVLAEAAATLAAPGRPARTQLRVGDPAAQILELAEKQKADLIVAGARGVSRLERLLMGSVADRLLKEANCSLLIVH